ncbi:SIMPL domain-containing protein [Modestobacter versicolor]|uniref:SIMPL domain-containing protein n=1 Tax=Modestobacter versicolor TaxID=429133 RepID=UPI0034DFAEE0
MTVDPRVVVRGEAVTEALPDAADLVVTVEVRHRRRDEALTALAARQRALTALLAAQGDVLGAVSTDAVAVHPEQDGTRVTGQVAAVVTRVQVEQVDAAGALAAAVAALPDTSLYGPHWRLSRSSPAHQQVRTEAVADAIGRANAYAAALGCRLTGLVEVRDTGGGGAVRALAALAPASPQLELRPAPQEVRGSVEVTFTMSVPDEEVFQR